MLSSTATDEVSKALVDGYKILTEAAQQRASNMFDTMVVKALLPVLTAILGYIFGARAQRSND